MVYIYVHHTVEDYGKWKAAFDAHAPLRKAGGSTENINILRNADDPNDLTVLIGWSDLQKARAFSQSPELRAAMAQAGVTSQPTVRFLEAAA